jgi:AAA family ATP:ADP antiporter
MILPALQYIFRPIFGEFEREEFKKFLRMGLIFGLIIGTYWALRTLKDPIFNAFVDIKDIPYAKTASFIMMFPLIMIYTRLFDVFSREQMFYVLSCVYGTLTAGIAFVLYNFQQEAVALEATSGMKYYLFHFFGYFTYVFIESYGSLVVALFWAFATNITDSDSAKKGFYLVTALGQVGGIFGPAFITPLAKTLGHSTTTAPFIVCTITILMVGVLMRYFMVVTPKNMLASFHGKNEVKEEEEQEPGFFEGLRLLVSHKYLLGIFGAIAIYEIIVTMVDYQFKVIGAAQYFGQDFEAFMGWYGMWVNIVSLTCLLLGVSNITRYLGVGAALVMMPIIVGLAFSAFIYSPTPMFLLVIMVGAKAVNYALNGPAMKQLYIPTTPDVRSKSQAWIETFGSRGAKQMASNFNFFYKSLGAAKYMMFASVFGYSLIFAWFFVAVFLGKTYKKAIDEKRVVC